jgi:riboflavin synthase
MFTGIVRAVGRVVESPSAAGVRLGIESQAIVGELQTGASVAVNGCCLTVTATEGAVFFADVVPETLSRTNLGGLGPGSEVNLELPLTLSDRLDGHLVQGHVDGSARVLAREPVELGEEITIELPPDLARYVTLKGSVAVDGVSLTVAGLDGGSFKIALIPHTLAVTIAHTYAAGSLVNLEVDLLARHVERLLHGRG